MPDCRTTCTEARRPSNPLPDSPIFTNSEFNKSVNGRGIPLEFIRLMELHAEQVHARVLEGGGEEKRYES